MFKFSALFLIPLFSYSQNHYSVDSIPEELKKNVDAVIRLDETYFKIKNIGSAVLTTHLVVTIFNDRGAKKYRKFYTTYDKLTKLKKVSGVVYDKKGSKIFKLQKKDFFDMSFSALSNDVTDNRQRITEFDNKGFQFPYTIDFFSEVKTTNMMFYPSEYFRRNEHISTQEKTLVIETPSDFVFRFKEKNMPNKVAIVTNGNSKKYTWTIKNISADKYEAYTPPDIYPAVLTAPKEFSVENYQGQMESWNDAGKFVSTLNQNRDILPDNIKLKVKELIQNEKDTLKKINILYNYLQNTTHYMSIQLGIGGWQTITAKEVANKGYGDCKALSNYMKALLHEAGIPSFVAIVRGGSNEEDIEGDFPNMEFNHMINCVPLKNDTIWLECTSQTNTLGYQGSFTGNRKALLILPDGGRLVNTCKYNSFDNIQSRKANITVDELGNAKAQVITTYKGIEQEYKNYILYEKNKEQQRKLLENSIPLSSFELTNFSFVKNKSRIPSIEENLDMNIQRLSNKSGTLFFIKPNIMNTMRVRLPENDERRSPFYLPPNVFNVMENDSLSFNMPENLNLEFMPESVSIKSKFGEYAITLKFQNHALVYYRTLIFNAGYFPASDYKEWRNFINKINISDQVQVAFTIK